MRNRTVGRPPSGVRTASDRSHPRSARQASAPWTTRGSVRPVHSFRYTSRAVNGLGSRQCVSWAASSAAATRA